MAEEENKNEEPGTPAPSGDTSETTRPAVKKAAPRKKAVRKKAVKKKAVKPAAESSEPKPDAAASSSATAEKLAAMGMMSDSSMPHASTSQPPHRIWWKALIMIAIVLIAFNYIRGLAKGPAGESAADVDTATIPAEVLNATNATQGTAPAQAPTATPQTPPNGYAQPHPWSMPPSPQQQRQDNTGMPAQPPYYPPVPPQGYYGYPQPWQPPYPGQPQQQEGDNAPAQPYYPAPPQGYYGYPYPPQPPAYSTPYQQ